MKANIAAVAKATAAIEQGMGGDLFSVYSLSSMRPRNFFAFLRDFGYIRILPDFGPRI